MRERLGVSGEIAVRQFAGGHSNLTYLVQVGEREVVLRRPPHGAAAKGGHDMPREYRILEALAPTDVPVAKPVALCEDAAVLGAPFYLMERVVGVVLRDAGTVTALTDATSMRAVAESFVGTLARIHAVKSPALAALGKGEGYCARQVKGWTERYAKARTDDIADMNAIAEWMPARIPSTEEAAFIHNDFKYDNLMLAPRRLHDVVAVLDWEMATVGDPLLDLGTSLGYWTDPDDAPELRALSLSPTLAPGGMTRLELAQRYQEVSGRRVGDMVFAYVLALFKIATIAQQIYARYALGHTKDPRFAALGGAVRVLASQARRAMAANRIHGLAP
ncbi:MAG TPA: phosphotransferase family protein, partial [Myxococcota bacterium]|nr:phosphotransferase family protein [Myxococcota bacterium]